MMSAAFWRASDAQWSSKPRRESFRMFTGFPATQLRFIPIGISG
jgi:hypothetical protein